MVKRGLPLALTLAAIAALTIGGHALSETTTKATTAAAAKPAEKPATKAASDKPADSKTADSKAADGKAKTKGAAVVPKPTPKPELKTATAKSGTDQASAEKKAQDGAGDAAKAASTDADVIGKAGAIVSNPAEAVGAAKSFFSSITSGSLPVKAAVGILSSEGGAQALTAAKALTDSADRKLVLWIIATSTDPTVTAPMIAEAMAELKDWPGQTLLRLRYEIAFLRTSPDADAVLRTLGQGPAPVSEGGTLALARAYLSKGKTKEAADLIRANWRIGRFSQDMEKAVLADFADALSKADHRARMDALLYDGRSDDGLRAAKLLDKDIQALADAWIAVIKRNSKATAKLAAVPAALQKDPAFLFATARNFRRLDKYPEAATALLAAPTDPKLLVDPDAWSSERRFVGRQLIEDGDAKTAYSLASAAIAQARVERVESEWDAGWYAFQYLKDPKLALPHFRAIGEISNTPLSQARSAYWQGRVAEALGAKDAALTHFGRAAQFPTAFYGQLAIAKLGINKLDIATPPIADEAAKKRFEELELVRAINRLGELGRQDDQGLFYRLLAERLTDPVQLALLANMAEQAGDHQMTLSIGKTAQQRGIGVDALAFPMAAIPKLSRDSDIELPAIYAVARQESSFDVGAISRAGAMGLMQLMPGTAKETAGSIGIPYAKARLTSDAAYNATLGAAHLAALVGEFNGSYAMTFAAYNAGRSRVYEWIKLHGDPRDAKVDPIDWIEKIPFSETRNYVQRCLENLQVYRARAGLPILKIEADITGAKS